MGIGEETTWGSDNGAKKEDKRLRNNRKNFN